MGYFSNGEEGMAYEEAWCLNCCHYGEIGENCAVLEAHSIYNYAECNNQDSILHILIPRDGLGNARCGMYISIKQEDRQWKRPTKIAGE